MGASETTKIVVVKSFKLYGISYLIYLVTLSNYINKMTYDIKIHTNIHHCKICDSSYKFK